MIVVGLTGGIGSGKSTVAKMFEYLDVPVYYSDIEAKKLMHSKKIKIQLINRFGDEVYSNKTLNRPFLANLIFTNKNHLQFVNSVVHPEVASHFKQWVSHQKKALYVIQENAILFENNTASIFDKIITVTAPIDIKINRVMTRDSVTKEQVLHRMKNQWTDDEKIKKSDFVIENTNLKMTEAQVLKIHKKLSAFPN